MIKMNKRQHYKKISKNIKEYKEIFFQMCLSVAMMSPTQYELAYGDPGSESVDITNVDVKKKIGWTGFEILHNQTVKVFGTEKMNLRGECFLLAGQYS